jgi:uncharacterized protein (DUF486 family)
VRTLLLLLASNVFMTFAWYGHLRFKSAPLVLAILASWGIAFFEYCLQVPANRYGYLAGFSAFQLKIMQEAITLVVFVAFAVLWLKESPRWNHAVAFVLVVAAVYFAFLGRKPDALEVRPQDVTAGAEAHPTKEP